MTMGSYYYIEDKNSEFGFTSVPEDDYAQAVLRIAKKRGFKITDNLILREIEELNRKQESK